MPGCQAEAQGLRFQITKEFTSRPSGKGHALGQGPPAEPCPGFTLPVKSHRRQLPWALARGALHRVSLPRFIHIPSAAFSRHVRQALSAEVSNASTLPQRPNSLDEKTVDL